MRCPQSKIDMLRCNQLLDAAEELIDERGVVSFRFAQMAKEAKCSNHSLYKFFQSKEDVLACLFMRNCTSNYIPLYLKETTDLSPLELAALPALFSLAAVERSPTFNTLRVVSTNSMFWQMASDDKINLLRDRSNLFWSRLTLHVHEACERGAFVAPEEVVKEFIQALYFFLAGSLVTYESKLMGSEYVDDRGATFCTHLAGLFNRFGWEEEAKPDEFIRRVNEIGDFLDRNYSVYRNCEHCIGFREISDCEQLQSIPIYQTDY